MAIEFFSNLKKVSNYYEVLSIDVEKLQSIIEMMKINLKFINAARTI